MTSTAPETAPVLEDYARRGVIASHTLRQRCRDRLRHATDTASTRHDIEPQQR